MLREVEGRDPDGYIPNRKSLGLPTSYTSQRTTARYLNSVGGWGIPKRRRVHAVEFLVDEDGLEPST